MKKMLLLLSVALCVIVLLPTCRKWDKPHKKPKYVERVQTDSMVVDFPPGSVISEAATLRKVSDPNIQYTFDETADLFRVERVSPFQFILDIGNSAPQNDSVMVTITLPKNAKSPLPGNFGYELFAQVLQDAGEEELDLFEIIPSIYNSSTNTLMALLPAWVFTNRRNSNQTYEAIFTIAATPGAPLTISSLSQISSLMPRLLAAAANEECKAGQINCPVGSIEDCTNKQTSPYGSITNPVTGKSSAIHWGVDYGVATGTAVRAVSDGKIEKVKTQTDKAGNVIGYGTYIVVRHADKSASLYAHLSSTNVQAGADVKANQQIALSGNTGKSTGPHLHFEYVPNGEIVQSKSRVDPSPCISEGNANGSITIRDNGNLADDAFELFLDDVFIGRTEIGASNSVALSNLRPGDKTLKLTCIVAPDNVVTYEVLLNDGIVFKGSGGDRMSGVLPNGGSASWPITIPTTARATIRVNTAQPNSYIEK